MNFCNQLVIVGGGGFIGCSLVSRIQEYDIDLICVSKTFQWGIDLYKSKIKIHRQIHFIHLLTLYFPLFLPYAIIHRN